MRYGYLGGTGLRVSPLCLGTVAFGTRLSPQEAGAIWARCVDAGINFFDTADAAPESERLVGELAGGHRDALVIATKVFRPSGQGPNAAGLSRKHIVQACEASLRRLNTDYIDLYLAHSDDGFTPLEETLGAFDQLIRQGKILYIGASNHTAWRLNEALWVALTQGFARYCCTQLLYNLQERDIEVELLPMCVQKNVGVVAWGALARGVLAAADPADRSVVPTNAQPAVAAALADVAAELQRPRSQVALSWTLNRPGISAAAFAVSSLTQLEENLGAVELQLSPAHMAALDAAAAPARPYPANLEPLVRALRCSD